MLLSLRPTAFIPRVRVLPHPQMPPCQSHDVSAWLLVAQKPPPLVMIGGGFQNAKKNEVRKNFKLCEQQLIPLGSQKRP
ncbi:unnamed protein product [Boreogadus saida]